MAVIIENIGGNPNGSSKYLLRVGEKEIAKFKHNRPEGLAQCLKKAYQAAAKAESESRGAALKELRLSVGLTLREVSRLADVSISYLSDIEHGRKPFSKVAKQIAAKLEKIKVGTMVDTTP